jgi:hypothetical protein
MDTEMLPGWLIDADELSQLHPPPYPSDASIVRVRGVTGDPMVVEGLDKEPDAAIVVRSLPWSRAVRPRVVLASAGLLLMMLSAASALAAAAWHAPSTAAMAGASGFMGTAALLAGATRH